MKKFFFLITILIYTHYATAENLELMRRWVVFPFETSSSTLRAPSDNAWLKVRSRIVDQKRFLVASKQFLKQKDVFQPRKNLQPEDVKILAKLLDANVIVTGYSEFRQFTLNAYLGQNGTLFWSKTAAFHPNLRSEEQIEVVSDRLIQDFLNSIPYHGFTIVDPLIGKAVFEESGKTLSVIDVGSSESFSLGMQVQWIEIYIPDHAESQHSSILDSKLAVTGEGKVVKIKKGVVIAELQKANSREAIKEKTLVRFPQLIDKPNAYVSNKEDPKENSFKPEELPTLINPLSLESDKAKEKTLLFGSILSILGILALAF